MNFEDCSHTLIDVHTIFIISPRTFIYIYIYLERERELIMNFATFKNFRD